jgi:peptidylprolyl isomerase
MPETGNTLTLETTKGPVVIELRPDLAPAHIQHIKRLAGERFL